MTKFVSFRWKEDFKDSPWHEQHPAEQYLSWQSKADLMELYILGEEDKDSEAEVFIDEYNNTN
jgi:hypothetical protein